MPNLKNIRAAADRIRTATLSLSDPHDLIIVRAYLHELEEIAREQEAELERRPTLRLPLDSHVHLPRGNCEAETESKTGVIPLRRTAIRGRLGKTSPAEGRDVKWVLTLDDPNQQD